MKFRSVDIWHIPRLITAGRSLYLASALFPHGLKKKDIWTFPSTHHCAINVGRREMHRARPQRRVVVSSSNRCRWNKVGSGHYSEWQHQGGSGNQKLTANHAVGQIFMRKRKIKVWMRKQRQNRPKLHIRMLVCAFYIQFPIIQQALCVRSGSF